MKPAFFMTFTRSGPVRFGNALNEGLLPDGYCALAEQHAGRAIADVLTLHESPEPQKPAWLPPDTGGSQLLKRRRAVWRKQRLEPAALARRRSLAIRHVSGHRLIALIEIISPANKDRSPHIDELVSKAVSALERGVHVLLIDLFPPGPQGPSGIHGCVVRALAPYGEPYDLPPGPPYAGELCRGTRGRYLSRTLGRRRAPWRKCRYSCGPTAT